MRQMVDLVFRPAKLAKEAEDLETRREPGKAKRSQFEQAIADIRGGFAKALFLVAATTAAGIVTAKIGYAAVGAMPRTFNSILQFAGIGVLLWATLAKQGWNIQTFDGDTLPERLDQVAYRLLYLFGSFVLVLSVAWPAV